MNKHRVVITDGWEPVTGIPEDDYQDFACVRQSMDEVRRCLNMGYFPPGLILFDGETRAQVTGRYFDKQALMRL